MKTMGKLAMRVAVTGVGVLYLSQAVAWWGGGDRWRDRDWWDRPGYWGGYPGYGGWGAPGYGWGGYPGYGGWGYPGYGWGGQPYATQPRNDSNTGSQPAPPPLPQ